MLVYRGFDTHCLMIAQISPSPHSPLEHVLVVSVFLFETKRKSFNSVTAEMSLSSVIVSFSLHKLLAVVAMQLLGQHHAMVI